MKRWGIQLAGWCRAGSISRRLLLGIGLLCAAALLVSSIFWRESEQTLVTQARASETERSKLIDQLLSADDARWREYVRVQGAWTELAAAVGKDTKVVRRLLGENTGANRTVTMVFDADGRPEVVVSRSDSPLRKFRLELPRSLRRRLARGEGPVQFYASGPSGYAQVYVDSIVRSEDTTHAGEARGYVALARPLDRLALDAFGKRSGTAVELLTVGGRNRLAAQPTSDDRFRYIQPLADARGHTIAYRHFTANAPLVAQYRLAVINGQLLVVTLVLGVLLTLGLMLGTLVASPLRRMGLAIQEGDTLPIQAMMDDATEIGQQARLIESWFLMRNELMNTNEWLEREVKERTQELDEAYTATIRALVSALEYRDQETKGHCERVTEMAETIGRELGMTDGEIEDLRRGALLHDIGKIAIPDGILLKPGKLTPEERTMMETHAEIGYDMLREIRFLDRALDIPRCHHEKWDGTGYPHGLAGDDIPMPARIFALVDVWDALSTTRPYRKAWSPEKVRAHILEGEGTHFDPTVIAAFKALPLGAFPSEWRADDEDAESESKAA